MTFDLLISHLLVMIYPILHFSLIIKCHTELTQEKITYLLRATLTLEIQT